MSKKTAQLTAFALPGGESETSDISRLIKKYIFHWPLFLVAVVLAMVGAYFYIKATKPTYPIVATLEFKVPVAGEGGTVLNKSGTETQLDPISNPVIVENEIEVMQSKKLMYQVIMDLQLWARYDLTSGATKKELYKNTPVRFSLITENGSLDGLGEKLEIILKDSKTFTLADEKDGDKDYAYSTPIKSRFGTWQLAKTGEFNNYPGATLVITVRDPDIVTDDFMGKVKVDLENKDAPFVILSTTDQIPTRGKDVLNTLMDRYKTDAMTDKNKEAENTINFINSRLDSLRSELAVSEKEIERYKSSVGMTDISSQAQGFRDIKQLNIRTLNEVDIQLSIINGIERSLASSNHAILEKLPASSGLLDDPTLQALYDKLGDRIAARERLLATVPEANPMFTPINEEIKSLRETFDEKVKGIKSALLTKRQTLQSFGGGIQKSLELVPDQDRTYNSMKRNQESKEKIFTFLLEKREQVSLRYASSISDAEVVDDAHAGKSKWPLPAVIYGAALILGLGAAAAILYAREMMNEQITHRRQIEDAVSVPVLGELSYQESDTPIVVTQGRGKFAIGEQFRVLRTNLSHLHANNDPGRVTLFTSSIGSEGKSFVSSNLAVTLAYASRKTIILEMDLRKPKVSGIFDLNPDHPGIGDFLSGKTSDLGALIQKSNIPGLDVLSCGPILPNPSELLETERLDELINLLKTTYDDIIIDSPPIHLVTDALIIARTADASVYMIRQGYTMKEELDFINEIDKAKRFPKFTIVFNGIRRDKFGYGYGYGYSYGYGGYKNSYYNSYTDREKETFGTILKGFLRRF
ncbi:GumC family protein [Hufsiella ginkgonis]|uniref:Polysaccharide biosynthesis tyrosine autokinase n=1 Tax=Hufsiella ginkgonis TaxID=2695274 RepID=A0A7K1Y2C7_9SPHI|nr:tyrosine-protein kinase family protein [Hufsiella ginkgonis]MXV17433.1 polysaccharide biosynthesis tyrosine autokinase [Hufsiella ginkgonis]